MILNSLTLNNFRQFVGEQTIEFTKTKDKNITIIHGENGSGKTTLLNALTWCLYNHTGHDFEESDYILSKKAVKESSTNDTIKCSVELRFEDNEIQYEAIRSYEFVSLGSDDKPRKLGESFDLFIKSEGQRKKVDNPSVLVNRVIPQEMHNYFFFNGERIDKLALRTNATEIREAIKVLLGITILERSLEHLKSAKSKLSKELRDNKQVDHKSKEILSRLEELNEDLSATEKYLEQSKKNIDSLRKDNEAIRDKLKNFDETKELEEKRDILLADEKELSATISETNKKIRKFTTRKSCFSFMGEVFEDVNEIFATLKTSNILPNNVKEDFIKRLLSEHMCICERDLPENSDTYKAVAKLLDYSISKDIDQNISIMKSNLLSINEKMENNPEELNELISDRAKSSSKLEKVSRQLDELKKSLKGIENREDIQKLRIRFEGNEDKIDKELKDSGKNETKIAGLKQKITDLEKSKKSISQKDQQTSKLMQSLDFTQDLIDYTQKVYDIRITEIRSKLSTKINNLFRNICKKDYYIRMNEDFVIDVVDSDSDSAKPVGKSTGENQITSLSFIGSILEFAREIKENEEQYGSLISKFGGSYPLVMDSPFGSLDQTYSQNIAESLPGLSEQIVLMVSSTQWRSEVKEGMISKVGKQYILSNHTSKLDEDVNVTMSYNDKNYFFSKSTDGPEYTEVEELI